MSKAKMVPIAKPPEGTEGDPLYGWVIGAMIARESLAGWDLDGRSEEYMAGFNAGTAAQQALMP